MKPKNNGFTLIELIVVVVIIAVFVSVIVRLASPIGLMPNYSNGERVGYVTKLSYKGLTFKTHEGQLQPGQGSQSALQEPFNFSVSKDRTDVLQKLENAAQKGTRVRLKYRQWLIMSFFLGESGYEIVEVLPTK
ncbi:hypothetical protein A3G55_04105 [Candidatus Giovannonibacteria bacterium RIFCSPLOWO2_12_FULL_44_25]|uniref:Prepilin-type N-terminal cleavage/methylation domain-containing protein n=4 Tax=Parcubacteria group TaxID=1794811 RepID=A0A837IJM8_9BACT|nr:MAG: hypothetical protein UW15_C0005G0009 [Parcubacteria group bacterium GW2011_GWC1_44_10]KKT56989.1 MAG: hypothetical protein UW49_C0009G0010 [Candidatus Giovannonibacteria bacterium GW2011_GWB1_44_23]KKT59600.1 MAG: hypothetical protein UW53_C0010G0010 [Candidatus Giovannonibacteria bacterium GW2011_GWA1_44_25]KKU12506.1 MAG: hypothetical protein UX18_C0021G0002 [Candidatus Azambacteria bacterium GW2011_GWC2_45_7b]OGF49856.1 MAG: hypothetical protein A2120_01390 [Candidatus Giovannonibact